MHCNLFTTGEERKERKRVLVSDRPKMRKGQMDAASAEEGKAFFSCLWVWFKTPIRRELSSEESAVWGLSDTEHVYCWCVHVSVWALQKKRGTERVIWTQHEVKTITPADRLRTNSYSSLMQAQTHPTNIHNLNWKQQRVNHSRWNVSS